MYLLCLDLYWACCCIGSGIVDSTNGGFDVVCCVVTMGTINYWVLTLILYAYRHTYLYFESGGCFNLVQIIFI